MRYTCENSLRNTCSESCFSKQNVNATVLHDPLSLILKQSKSLNIFKHYLKSNFQKGSAFNKSLIVFILVLYERMIRDTIVRILRRSIVCVILCNCTIITIMYVYAVNIFNQSIDQWLRAAQLLRRPYAAHLPPRPETNLRISMNLWAVSISKNVTSVLPAGTRDVSMQSRVRPVLALHLCCERPKPYNCFYRISLELLNKKNKIHVSIYGGRVANALQIKINIQKFKFQFLYSGSYIDNSVTRARFTLLAICR